MQKGNIACLVLVAIGFIERESAELEGTHQNHQVQLLALVRTP